MPPTYRDFESLGSLPLAIAGAALLICAAHGAGRFAVAAPANSLSRSFNSLLLRLTVGLNFVGWLGVSLGEIKLLQGSRSLLLLGGLAAINFLPPWRTGPYRLLLAARISNGSRRKPLPRWAKLAALTVSAVTLGPALCYPTGWDELVYHHELPRRWLADGRPAVYFDLPYSGFPSLGEILFRLISPLDGVIAPRLVTWLSWMLGLAIVYRVLRLRLAAESAAAVTLGLTLSSTMLLTSANCYIEPILMLNVAALVLALGDRRLTGSPVRQAIVLGILAGGAAAVKLTGLVIFVAVLPWYFAQLRIHSHSAQEREEPRISRMTRIRQMLSDPCSSVFIRGFLLFCLSTALVAGPFYLRPWLLTGDPFYPYLGRWFSTDPARLEMSQFHHELGSKFGLRGVAAFFEAPVFLAFVDHYVDPHLGPLYDGSFGWQLLIVLGLAAVAARTALRRGRMPLVVGPAIAAAWLYCFWFFTAQQARFAIPAVIALLPLSAMGLRRTRGVSRKLVLLALVGALLASAPWRTAGHYFGSWLAALGVISRTAYVDESTDKHYLPLIRAVAERTPADARLMLLFEHRGFYLPRSYTIGTPFFQEGGFTPPEQFTDPAKIMEVLAREKITHVVVPKTPAGPDVLLEWVNRTDPFFAAFAQCVQRDQLRPIWQSERYVLFEVTPAH